MRYRQQICDAVESILDGKTDATQIEKGFSRRIDYAEMPLVVMYVTGSRNLRSENDGSGIFREASLYIEYTNCGDGAEGKVDVALQAIEDAILEEPNLRGAARTVEFVEDGIAVVDYSQRVCAGVVEYRVALETHVEECPEHFEMDPPVDPESLTLEIHGEITDKWAATVVGRDKNGNG